MARLLIIFFFVLTLHNSLAQGFVPGGGPQESVENQTLEALTIDSEVIMTGTVTSVSSGVDLDILFKPDEILKFKPYVFPPYVFPIAPVVTTPRTSLHLDRRLHRDNLHGLKPGSKIVVFESQWGGLNDLVTLDPLTTLQLTQGIRDINFQPVRDAKRFMEIVREELQRSPPATREHFLTYFPSLSHLYVPAGDRLLPAARQWVHSDVPAARCAAARVFAAHPDPVDTPALYELLRDPYTVDEPYMVSPWSGHEYVIRQAAYQALVKRGAPIPAVALFEPRTDLYHPLPWVMVLWLIPIPLYVIIRRPILRRLRRHQSTLRQTIFSTLNFACLYFALLTVLLFMRGRQTADDIVYAKHGCLINLTFAGGHVWIETATHWPGTTSLVHIVCT
ncbi:MAG: HEAT repeat domain-containing protein, partial [Phycisphaerae bacterium]